MLKLVAPTKENLQRMKAGLIELEANPTPFDIRQAKTLIEYLKKGLEVYLEHCQQRRGEQQPEGYVPETTLFLFDDEKFIGFYNIRHSLNDHLKKEGGHIAYQIIPSERGKGYVKQGLKLVLKWCHDELGLDEVLLTCHAENQASDKAMTSVMNEIGGKRDSDIQLENGSIERHVWIHTIKGKQK